ncbi:hypothetical protein V6N11_031705 [Hibiscus sabdariffa]|uniref:EF-hand domain-containing protein n=1 Tax=Hibiscus sabdariffa TaxID=183260 RepID=A0ABR2SZ84_9ROSI
MADPNPKLHLLDPPPCSQPTSHHLTVPTRLKEDQWLSGLVGLGTEKEGMVEIGELFEEEESSLMEVKEDFDVLDENGDGFIDADELRNALLSFGFVKEAEQDNYGRMIKGVKIK